MKHSHLKYFTVLFACLALILTSCNPENFFNQPYTDPDPAKSIPESAQYYPEKNVLQTDSIYRMAGQQETAEFSVALTQRDIASGKEPVLFSLDGTALCKLYDDGKAPDRHAGDGIYSCSYDVTSENGEQKRYYVQTGDKKTEEICLTYFDELTEDDINRFHEINDVFSEAVSEYTNEEGYTTDPEKALAEAKKIAESLYENGEAVDYSYEPDNGVVYVKLSSGIAYLYTVKEEGTLSGATGLPGIVTAKATQNPPYNTQQPHSLPGSVIGKAPDISISTYLPSDHMISSFSKMLLKKPDDAVKALDIEFNNAITAGQYYDSEVTRIRIWDFIPNEIIIWEGHSSYTDLFGTCILLGEYFDTDEIKNSNDYIHGRVICTKDGCIGITPKFIKQYCGNLSNALVYMGCCSTGKDSRLAESFLDKGAALFIGNNNTVSGVYSFKMVDSFITALTMKKDGTYYTAEQALNYAKEKHGKHDAYLKYKSKVLLFGDKSFTMDPGYLESHPVKQLTNPKHEGSDYIELDHSYISMKVGEQRELTITHVPDRYNLEDASKSKNIFWGVENPSVVNMVSPGVFEGVGRGSTIIYVKTLEQKYYYCACRVY